MMELKIMYFVHGTTVDNAAGNVVAGNKLN